MDRCGNKYKDIYKDKLIAETMKYQDKKQQRQEKERTEQICRDEKKIYESLRRYNDKKESKM